MRWRGFTASIARTSSSSSAQSKTSRFPRSRSGLDDLGNTEHVGRVCSAQRSRTCPTFLPVLSATAITAGSFITAGTSRRALANIAAESGEPSGEYAVKWMSFSAQYSISAALRQYGWHSAWQTDTGCRARFASARSFGTEKLETPMCFTSPRSTSRSMACQVSSKGGSTPPDLVPFSFPEATGQCMRYRSRYDVRNRASDARHACSTSAGACASFHSLEVTNTSRRLSLVFKNTSAIPSPTSCSFSYTDAQSTCVYPARNAASTASRAAPGSVLFHVPRPTSGMDAPVGFSEPSGWCGRRVTSGRSSRALRSSSSRSLEARATSVSRLICSHRARSLARRTAGPPVTSKKSTRPRPLGETWSGRDRNASIRASPCRWRVAASFSSCGAHTRLQSRLQPASRWNASGGGSAAKTASRSSGGSSEPASADIPSRAGVRDRER